MLADIRVTLAADERLCPHCAANLPTALARQCFDCGADWRQAGRIVLRGGSAGPKPRTRGARPIVPVLLACVLAQMLFILLIAVLAQFPQAVAPAAILGFPVVAFWISARKSLPGQVSSGEKHRLQRVAFILLSAVSVLAPAAAPAVAATAFLAAIAYGAGDLIRARRHQRAAAVPMWLLLFSAAMFTSLFFGARQTAVAAVAVAFAFAEILDLLSSLSRWTRRRGARG